MIYLLFFGISVSLLFFFMYGLMAVVSYILDRNSILTQELYVEAYFWLIVLLSNVILFVLWS